MLINLIGFNVSWFGLVYWGNNFIPVAFLLLLAHLFFQSKNYKEFLLIVVVSVIGISVDSLLQQLALFIFLEPSHIPFWLMMLWASFAATICHSLNFLASSKMLQLAVGGLISPLSYIAGYKFMVVDFGYSMFITYVVLALVWGGLFILFYYLKGKIMKGEMSYA
ncbi:MULTISPECIES: DUF2878 domain-containing protein [unclassified Colwellia]|uniref:DUF2878 domain-containing protein n=1 Tax=unclassified Colwellia TaxID=196834 RepID=UPI0015F59A7C|nr:MULTISPECIES: DUF2878 domain-containing protein [unclassified Colwellia]MBA6256399.1 DUF2878 domain-containing protein [Colwellia sp. MB3u-28]MBA6260399.1 DUF2878 domain-containing protein [Colwellia sp. MB3u-41]